MTAALLVSGDLGVGEDRAHLGDGDLKEGVQHARAGFRSGFTENADNFIAMIHLAEFPTFLEALFSDTAKVHLTAGSS
jgi:hypothetical protein